MSEDSVPMSPDSQEARSIRYSSLVAVALLESGRWAIYTTTPLGRESFRNEVRFFDQFPAQEIQAACSAERLQRRLEEQEYEERRAGLAAGPAVAIKSTETLEDMGL